MNSFFLDLHNPDHLHPFLLLFLISNIVYFVNLKTLNFKNISYKKLFIFLSFINLIFLAVPFITSNDIHSYIFVGRIFGVHKANPYLIPYDAFPMDSYYSQIRNVWSDNTTLYGPLFILLSGAISAITKSLLINVVLLKSVLILANLYSGHLIYKITKRKLATFAYLANPLVVLELSGNAHTESLLILFMLLGVYLIKTNIKLSLVSLTASVLIKYSTGILLPLFIIYKFPKEKLNLGISLFLSFALIILTFLPLWEGTKIFNYLLSYYRGQYPSPSLGILLLSQLIPYSIAFTINNILFVLISAGVFVSTYKNRKQFNLHLALIYLAYILTKLSLVLPWYLTPLIALAAINIKDRPKFSNKMLIFTFAYSTALYYFVR